MANQQQVTIRPSLKKVIILTTLGVIGTIVAGLGLLLFMHFMQLNLFESLKETLETLGIEIDTAGMVRTISIMVFLGILLVYALTTMKHNREYAFFVDKFVSPGGQEVPYQYITRINFDNSSLFQNIFNYGTLMIEAGGTDTKSFNIPFVNDVEKNAKYLQQVLIQFRAAHFQQQQQQIKINNIVDQY